MTSSPLTSVVVAWLGTYLLHSSCLMLAALAAERIIGQRKAALRETIWRAALLAPILTASLQASVIVKPLAGTIELGSSAAAEHSIAVSTSASGAATQASSRYTAANGPAATQPIRHQSPPVRSLPWRHVLIAVWLLGMVVGAIRFADATIRLRRLMRCRVQRPVGRFVRRLADAMKLAPPRVSTSQAIAAPFATGIRRPEICLPVRVVRDLDPSQLNGILAHEMAHIERRDPGWLHLYRLVHTIFFFQPLNRLARRHLQETAEVLADARAVHLTGDHLGLARSIVDVATWMVEVQPRTLVAAAAAGGPLTSRRVARLLSGNKEHTKMSRTATIAVFAVITLSIFILPSFSSSAAVAPREKAPSVAPAPEVEPVQPAPPVLPAPDAAPEPSAAPPAPAPPSAPDAERVMHEADASLAREVERFNRRVIEIEKKRARLEASGNPDPEAIAELAAERARLEDEFAGKRLELRERIRAAQKEAQGAALADQERARERAERAHARALEQRARAEVERQLEHERRRQERTVSQQELEKRLQELETREQALALREKELQAREEALRRREIPN